LTTNLEEEELVVGSTVGPLHISNSCGRALQSLIPLASGDASYTRKFGKSGV